MFLINKELVKMRDPNSKSYFKKLSIVLVWALMRNSFQNHQHPLPQLEKIIFLYGLSTSSRIKIYLLDKHTRSFMMCLEPSYICLTTLYFIILKLYFFPKMLSPVTYICVHIYYFPSCKWPMKSYLLFKNQFKYLLLLTLWLL